MVDSGASHHITPYEKYVTHMGERKLKLQVADKEMSERATECTMKGNKLGITKALYQPGIKNNL